MDMGNGICHPMGAMPPRCPRPHWSRGRIGLTRLAQSGRLGVEAHPTCHGDRRSQIAALDWTPLDLPPKSERLMSLLTSIITVFDVSGALKPPQEDPVRVGLKPKQQSTTCVRSLHLIVLLSKTQKGGRRPPLICDNSTLDEACCAKTPKMQHMQAILGRHTEAG